MKVAFEYKGNVIVITYGKSTNGKITDGKDKIVQTYTYSRAQYLLARDKESLSFKSFFSADSSNCLDCPFSSNQRDNGLGLDTPCYTHKAMQYSGFLSSLRTIKSFDTLDEKTWNKIVKWCTGSYVRFGTYGEPSLIPYQLIADMAAVSGSYTGYTHQWMKPWVKPFNKFFMASVHNQEQSDQAKLLGFRSFIALEDGTDADAVTCPASKEGGYRSTCEKCGLCSGTMGKGKRDVKIFEH